MALSVMSVQYLALTRMMLMPLSNVSLMLGSDKAESLTKVGVCRAPAHVPK